HESALKKSSILHRDVSLGNVLLDEDESDGFLNDWDLAVDITRPKASGAPGKTGTKVFMAIGALLDEPHSFMHDLESFFWVLFWICIYYEGPDMEGKPIKKFEDWNFDLAEEVAEGKLAVISLDRFESNLKEYVTDYCSPLIPLITKLWEAVFPNGRKYRYEDKTLYGRMRAELEKHQLELRSLKLCSKSLISLLDSQDKDRHKYLAELKLTTSYEKQYNQKLIKKPDMIGTRPFMAIGALLDEPHSFMHDLESFFWVLFWICLYYEGPNKERKPIEMFEEWNYNSPGIVADLKWALVQPKNFKARLSHYTTDYCRPMIPLVTKLWEEVFPQGRNYEYEDKTLYDRMKAHECQLHSINLYFHVLSLLELGGEKRFRYLDGLQLVPTAPRERPSMQGTKVFMAIGALLNEPHNFMHDLESFFWVLFWICLYYEGPNKERKPIEMFEEWNYKSPEIGADSKKSVVDEEEDFNRKTEVYFTTYCKDLIPCMKELREIVFPGGKRWKTEDHSLYSQVKAVIEKARDNLIIEEAV
ncbi:MAG: hypothetical protein M1816_004916, partial [Peltula sp. TS41687]